MILFNNSKISNYFIFLIGLLFFGGFYPALWNSILFGDYAIYVSLFFLFLWAIAFIIRNPYLSIKKINGIYLAYILLLILYFIIRNIIYGDEIIYLLLVLLTSTLAIIFAYSTIEVDKLMNYLIKFQILMIFLSIIGITLLNLGFIGAPNVLILSGFEDKIFLNYKLFLLKLNVYQQDIPSLYIRTSGYYDEPGSFAFVNLLLLIYNKLHLNNRKYETILLFGGIITLSAAHIITVALYLVLFYLNKKNLWIFLTILLIFTGIYFLPIEQEWFTFFKSRTYDRILSISEGTDRSRDFSSSYEAFKHFFITGGSAEEILNKYPSAFADTIWFTLAKNGFFGSIIYYSLFIYLLIKSSKGGLYTNKTKLIFLLIVNFIQRPEFVAPIYLVIIYFTWFYKTNTTIKLK